MGMVKRSVGGRFATQPGVGLGGPEMQTARCIALGGPSIQKKQGKDDQRA